MELKKKLSVHDTDILTPKNQTFQKKIESLRQTNKQA